MKTKTAGLRHPWGLVQRILSEDSREGAEGGLLLTADSLEFSSIFGFGFDLESEH